MGPTDPRVADVPVAGSDGAARRWGPADPARYRELLHAVRRPGDVALDAVATGPGRWTVAISTMDFLGALSSIVGLLTAYRLAVVDADILTLRLPNRDVPPRFQRGSFRGRAAKVPSADPSRVLLDVFEVRSLDEVSADHWSRFRSDLAALLDPETGIEARDDLIDQVSATLRDLGADGGKLLPVRIDVTNEVGVGPEHTTKLSVRSPDTPGFLFAFANALTGFAVDVERAEIRTVGADVEDTFWVTDARGGPISDPKRLQELRIATTLIKQFTYLLPRSPDPAQALRQFNALIAQMLTRPDWTTELVSLESPVVLEALAALMGVSRFLWEDFLRLQHESLFPLLLDLPALATPRSRESLQTALDARLADAATLTERVDVLNAFKDREMFRDDLRYVSGRGRFPEFSAELSDLAEVSVEAAVRLAEDELRPKYGRPLLADGRVCPWSVGGLGKFGSRELGFGSDLELIFVYEEQGVTDGPSSIPNSEYSVYLVQTFLRILRARQEGVFEIDLRLRPFGRAGALASSLSGFARYYAADGAAEQFERLALVRLRPVAGDPVLGGRVQDARDRFVYSGQPLDLGNILHLRRRQATELVPRGERNVKYSRGGLVDVEYFVQAWQIVAGASDRSVRVTNTAEAIGRLERGGYLTPILAEEILRTHDFLRRVIEGLRVVRGHAKDLTIPPDGSREFAYLARRLKLPGPTTLRSTLAERMLFARSLWTEAPPRGR